MARFASGAMIVDEKYGGLLTIWSTLLSLSELNKEIKSPLIIVIRLLHGDSCAFRMASDAASWSISIPVMAALLRWAAIIAISPVPVPTSKIVLASEISHHAPNKTPSVPTFIALSSLRMAKRLNLKILSRFLFVPMPVIYCVKVSHNCIMLQ